MNIKMEKISGSQILVRSLLKEGVDTIFGYPGGTIMPLYDELYNHKDTLRHILVRHEQGLYMLRRATQELAERQEYALLLPGREQQI
ncbi:hypothetical protein MASR2M69_25360 [Bacteroidota bacterium]